MEENPVLHDHSPLSDLQERPRKRPRVSPVPKSPQGVNEIPQQWDLQAARVQNDLRLKSIFEGIFAKYGNDFSEVGDEIDLESGEIVVDRGHLLGMREETDVGDWKDPWEMDPLGSDEEGPSPEEAPASSATRGQGDTNSMSVDTGSVGLTRGPMADSAGAPSEVRPGKLVSSPLGLKGKPWSQWHSMEPNSGPVDPLWQAPELPPLFATPKATRQPTVLSPQLPTTPREPSPPGSGSLWTVPRRRLPRSSQKVQGLATSSPSRKSRPRAKRKHQSSPGPRDWSFAEVAGGDESDDPLQEEWPSSPLPNPRQASRTGEPKTRSPKTTPVKMTAYTSPINNRSVDHRRQSPSREDRSVHSRSATGRDHHDRGHQSEVTPQSVNTAAGGGRHSLHDSVSPTLPRFVDGGDSGAAAAHECPSSSPIKTNVKFAPDEIKLIVCMRYVQERPWRDISAALPSHTLTEIYKWNQVHWSDRRAYPPRAPAPWSQVEVDILDWLAEMPGLSWAEIMIELPNRSQSEIEDELLRRWVGDEIWLAKQRLDESTVTDEPPSSASVHYETESRIVKIDVGHSDEENPQTFLTAAEGSSSSDSEMPTTPRPKPKATALPRYPSLPPSVEPRREFEDLVNSDGDGVEGETDDVMLLSAASSPSKLSSIYLGSPAPNRDLSRTPQRSPMKSPVKPRQL